MGLIVGCNQSQYAKKEKGIQAFTLEELLLACDCLGLEISSSERNSSGNDPRIKLPFPDGEGHFFGDFSL